MAINTLAQYHTNYMFKVVLSRELIQESRVTRVVYHEVEHISKPYINSVAHLSLSI